MSKKDYQAIARAIHRTRLRAPAFSQHFILADDPCPSVRMSAADVLTEEIVQVLAADNPRFDRARFIEACETGRCKGMPR